MEAIVPLALVSAAHVLYPSKLISSFPIGTFKAHGFCRW
jgi:hypothetical protein